MRLIAISTADERAMALHAEASSWQRAGLLTAGELARLPRPQWRTSHTWTRIAFFVLAVLATGALFALLTLMLLPKGYVTAAITVGLAEYLVARKRFLRTGIEEGLYISGLCSLIAGFPGDGSEEVILLFAAAFLLAGVRLANALFISVAPLLVVLYVALESGGSWPAALCALLMFVAAALLQSRTIERPFLSHALSILTALLLPLATLLWFVEWWPAVPLTAIALAAAAAAGLGAIAVLRRDRALLAASLLTLLVAVAHLFPHFAFSWEWVLLVLGVASLALSLLADRLLRGRERGITSRKLADLEHEDMIEMAGAVALAPERQAPPDQRPGGGGSFGGAGATGQF
ncbi:MAG TPA: hypothetical protein VNL91_05470 [Thermoanaerobaculia bacterium]|nr:hypothetical protein [Thermoanaerobaculia bacterium]